MFFSLPGNENRTHSPGRDGGGVKGREGVVVMVVVEVLLEVNAGLMKEGLIFIMLFARSSNTLRFA